MIEIVPINESYSTVLCDEAITKEIREFLTFKVPGAKYSPAYRNRHWNGTVCLMDRKNRIGRGLTDLLIKWAAKQNYSLTHHEKDEELSIEDALEWIKTLNLPFEPRDYQVSAFITSIRKKRKLIVSATSSGKSLTIYLILRYLYEKYNSRRILVVVPNISLVNQLTLDFSDYGFDSDTFVQKIQEGATKEVTKPIVVSTWQSLQNQPKEYFEQFDAVIGDEAHLFTAKKLMHILYSCVNAQFRIGMTGTLKKDDMLKLTLVGLFGSVYTASRTKDLIDEGHITSFEIKALLLKYGALEAKSIQGKEYRDEIDFLINHERRNLFIVNLALSLNTNTLVLFKYVEKHGKVLFDLLNDYNQDSSRKIFYVHGGIEGDIRESIRKIVETEKNAIIIASYGVFSTGINIKNLHNIVFASPSKSRLTILQSIGRALRLSPNKDKAILYDIADDLKYRNKKNYTYNHFLSRLEIYDEEKFPYKIYKLRINSNSE